MGAGSFRLFTGRKRLSNLLLHSRVGRMISEFKRFIWDSSHRARWHLIRSDYQNSKAQLTQLARSVSPGDKGKTLLIVPNGMVMGIKLEGIFGLIWQLKGFYPRVLELNYDYWMQKYFRSFGVLDFINFQKYLASIPPVSALPPDLIDFKNSRPTIGDLLEYRFHGVDIGRITLSNILYRNKFSKFDISSDSTLNQICDDLLLVQRNVIAAEKVLDQVRPTQVLLNEKGTSPNAELVGVCFNRDISVVQYVGSQNLNELVFKRFGPDNRHQHPFSLDKSTWDDVKKMPWNPELDNEILDSLEVGYRLGTWFNRKFLLQGKQIKNSNEVRQQLGLDSSKKTAVVFSHVLWDATFFYGKNLFEDYETWLMETIRAAVKNSSVNWVIKLHPDLVWKMKYENYSGELRDVIAMRAAVGNLPEHIKLVMPDTDISTFSFFEITDYCLTVRGTIGIEMACHGVPVLTAGTGRYSGLGFTYDFDLSEDYLGCLAHIQDLPSMRPDQIELARRYAYALFKLRPWVMESFKITRLPQMETGHPLDHNLSIMIKDFFDLEAIPDVAKLLDWINSDCVDYIQSNPDS